MMDPAALAGLCSLLASGHAPNPLPPGVACPSPPPIQGAPAGSVTTSFLADAVKPRSAREAIARVAFAEAGDQGDSGLAGVVYAILNRLADGRWGVSVDAVLNAHDQFEPVMRAGGDWRNLPPVSAAAQARIDTILNLALDGRLPDLTHGAHYFQNPTIVAERARDETVSARLVNFGGETPSAVIGAHSFFVGPGGGGGYGARSQTIDARRTPASPFIGSAPSAGAVDAEPAASPSLAGAGGRASGDPSQALFVGADGVVRSDSR